MSWEAYRQAANQLWEDYRCLKHKIEGRYSWTTGREYCTSPFNAYLKQYFGPRPFELFWEHWRADFVALKEVQSRRNDIEYLRSKVLPSFAIATWVLISPFFICAQSPLKKLLSVTPPLAVTVGIVATRKKREEQFCKAQKAFITQRERNAQLADNYWRYKPIAQSGADPKWEEAYTNLTLPFDPNPAFYGTYSTRTCAQDLFNHLFAQGKLTRQYFEEMH